MTNTNENISNESVVDRRIPIQPIRTTASLTAMTDEQLDRLSFEAKVLGDLRTGHQTRKAKLKAATVMGCSPATVYRKLRLFKETGNALALARGSYGFAWRSNLDPKTEEIVQRNLTKFLRKHRGKRVKTLIGLVIDDCKKEGVEPPSDRTIRRRFEQLPERTRYAHEHGSQAAADKFDVNKGSTPPARFPLERVQADHTPSDAWVVSEEG